MLENEDTKLISQYFKGDGKALEFLIRKYLKQIYGFAYRNVRTAADAEDITQEVFVKMWKNIRKFKKEKSFKIWLFAIAKNASIDFIRKKKIIPFSSFDDGKGHNIILEKLAGPKVSLEEIFDGKKALAIAAEELSPKSRTIFSFRHNDGLTFREIAKSLGESVNTVKSRYRRALSKIKKSFNRL